MTSYTTELETDEQRKARKAALKRRIQQQKQQKKAVQQKRKAVKRAQKREVKEQRKVVKKEIKKQIKADPSVPTPILWGLTCLLTQGFGAGMMTKAQGTWGSFIALFFAGFMSVFLPVYAFAGIILLVFILGWAASSYYLRIAQDSDDPSEIVIDEFVGQWLAVVMVPFNPWLYLIAFIFFRFFDILKPPPISWAERISGGFGVMADDAVAGLIAGVMVAAIYYGTTLAELSVPWG